MQQQQQQQSKTARFRLGNSKLFSYFRTLKWNPIRICRGRLSSFSSIPQESTKSLRRIFWRQSPELNCSRLEVRPDKMTNSLRSSWVGFWSSMFLFQITCYRMLPWKTMSRFWGWMNNVDLPVWGSRTILELVSQHSILQWQSKYNKYSNSHFDSYRYVRRFGCVIEEAEVSDLTTYSNLGEFFRRGLKIWCSTNWWI